MWYYSFIDLPLQTHTFFSEIAEDKVRLTSKTPDELIHAYFANMETGRRQYIGDW